VAFDTVSNPVRRRRDLADDRVPQRIAERVRRDSAQIDLAAIDGGGGQPAGKAADRAQGAPGLIAHRGPDRGTRDRAEVEFRLEPAGHFLRLESHYGLGSPIARVRFKHF
jgi:hypothetical protein